MASTDDILIVEDDESIRETLKMMFESEGYSVSEAANGQEGLDVLSHKQPPSMILLDLMMPVMNGWEFADKIGQDRALADTPIVLITAFVEEAKSFKKAQYVLPKPLSVDALLQTAKRFCD